MSVGFIDGAAILEVLELLGASDPEQIHAWALGSALDVTVAIFSTRHLGLSPIPDLRSPASGPYGEVLSQLAPILGHIVPDPQVKGKALSRTRKWSSRNVSRVSAALSQVKSAPEFPMWLEWLVSHQWQDHAQRHGGLFDASFLPRISKILDVDEKSLREIWARSQNVSYINAVLRNAPSSDEMSIMKDAFVLSTLLRGRYYDDLAKMLPCQVLHHPIRRPILATVSQGQEVCFPVSSTEWFLANIILSSALTERGAYRSRAWVENVQKVRHLVLSGQLDLRPKDTSEVSRRIAVSAAAEVGIPAHPEWMDRMLNAAVTVGLGTLTSFALSGFEGLGVSMLGAAAAAKVDLGRRTLDTVTRYRSRLDDMARFGPGRIRERWSESELGGAGSTVSVDTQL